MNIYKLLTVIAWIISWLIPLGASIYGSITKTLRAIFLRRNEQ